MDLRTSCFVARFPLNRWFFNENCYCGRGTANSELRDHNEGDHHDFDFFGNTHRESLAGTAERNFNWGLPLKTLAGDASFLGGGGGLGESSPRKFRNLDSDIVFATFSMRYLSKTLNLDKV